MPEMRGANRTNSDKLPSGLLGGSAATTGFVLGSMHWAPGTGHRSSCIDESADFTGLCP